MVSIKIEDLPPTAHVHNSSVKFSNLDLHVDLWLAKLGKLRRSNQFIAIAIASLAKA